MVNDSCTNVGSTVKLLRKVNSVFNYILDSLGLVASVLIVIAMLVVVTDVVMRYFLNRPIDWSTEITEYTLLFIAFLGAAWVLRREGHVRMDLVLNRLEPRTQALLNTVTSIIGAFMWLTITWFSVKATLEFQQLGFFFFTPLRTPKFIVMSVIPVGSALLFIQFMRRAYGYGRDWSGRRYQEQELQIKPKSEL